MESLQKIIKLTFTEIGMLQEKIPQLSALPEIINNMLHELPTNWKLVVLHRACPENKHCWFRDQSATLF